MSRTQVPFRAAERPVAEEPARRAHPRDTRTLVATCHPFAQSARQPEIFELTFASVPRARAMACTPKGDGLYPYKGRPCSIAWSSRMTS